MAITRIISMISSYVCSCFLNPDTGFVWSFIAPVIIILLINTVFLIMAAVKMWRHKKKQHGEMKAKDGKKWLKAVTSLVVVMGVTWIVGVLIVEVEKLLPLAYIYTIMVAFQGVWIFLFLVVFEENVREGYAKIWKGIKEYTFYSNKETLSTSQKNTLVCSFDILQTFCNILHLSFI